MTRIRCFLLIPLLVLAACSQPEYAAIPPGATVLVLGDSLSHGTGAGKGQDYPTLLAANTGWNVVNAGVPGDTTAGGLERLPDLLEEYAPQLLLVVLGGNDFLRRVPRVETSANLKSILALAKDGGVPAVLVAVPRPNLLGAVVGSLADDPIYEEIASETATPIVQETFSEALSKNSLKSDPIHPNAEGYRLVEENLRDGLRELGLLKRD